MGLFVIGLSPYDGKAAVRQGDTGMQTKKLPPAVRAAVALVVLTALAVGCEDPVAPVSCGSIAQQTVNVGETATVPVCFNDENGDMVSLSASSSNPAVATATLAGNAVTVTAVSPGTTSVTVTARDPGGLSATVSFSVTVPNRAPRPVGTIAAQTVTVGDTVTLDASGHFMEPDGQMLDYRVSSSAPGVATASAAGSTVTVAAVSAGAAMVTVTATDPDGASATQSFQVTVPNRPPQPRDSIPALTVEAGEEEAVELGPYFTDPDGDALTYSASSSASRVARVSVSGGTVTVAAVSAGTATVTATAADPHGATATQSFEVTVPNRAPQPRGSIPALTVEVGEDEAVDLEPYFTDPDGDALEYSASSSSARVAAVLVSGSSLTVRAARKGTATVTVTATDPGGASATQTFRLTVPNRAPVPRGSIPALTVAAGRTATVDAGPYFTDPDGDALRYSASSSAQAVATARVAGRLVTVTGVAPGTATVTVTATDPEGGSATQSFTVTVPNRAPVPAGTIPGQTLKEGAAGTVALATYFTDPDGDALQYSAVSSNVAAATVTVTGATLTIRAVRSGVAAVTVTARDPGGLTATQTFTVTVESGNRAPEPRGALPDRSLRAGSAFRVNLANVFTDPDGDALTFSATSSNTAVASVSVLTGSTLRVSGVAAGSATVTVTARDPGNLEATRSFGVTVTAGGPPDLVFSRVDPNAATAAPGAEVSVEFTIRNDGDRASATTNSRAYQSSDRTITTSDRVISDDIPVGALAPSATTTLRLRFALPAQIPAGTVLYVGMCVDPVTGEQDRTNNCSTAVTLTVGVGGANQAPQALGTIPPQSVAPGQTVSVNVSPYFTDPNGDLLSYTAASTNFTIATANISGSLLTIRGVAQGATTIVVTATDPGGLAAIQRVSVSVGASLVRLTSNSAADHFPAWSSDGTRIVFESNRDGNNEVYAMNANGSGTANLTNNAASDRAPAWSPDGARVAFVSYRDGNNEIYVMNANGSGVTNLTNNTAHEFGPAWSPDQTKIAFASSRDGNWEVYVMNANGSGVARLTNTSPATTGDAAWSPDGSRIAFRTNRDGNNEIYVMNANGSGVARLTNNNADDEHPDWSPDGTRIAFHSDRDGNNEIYVMNANGSGVTRLTNNSADDEHPDWSPDGTRIAFTSGRDGNDEVYVMSVPAAGSSAGSRVEPEREEPDLSMTLRASLVPPGPGRE